MRRGTPVYADALSSLSKREGKQMKYYRVHSEEIAYLTKQPRGIFTAIWKLVDAKMLTEQEKNNEVG